jgi:cytochrome c oxidase assembly factor CtaG
MTVQDIMLLVFFVSVFLVFGITLGFASWDETRRMQRLGDALPGQPKPADRERVHN